MRIMLVNDDGIFADGIKALALGLSAHHDVFIVAPEFEHSGCSHHFTMTVPLRVRQVTLYQLEHIPSYAVSGTPVDCAKLGIGNIGASPDIVISGANLGANLGTDTIYSGTVAAAMEGFFLSKPSMALSIDSYSPKHFDTAVSAAYSCIEILANQEKPMLINVNVPDIPLEEVRGLKYTALSRQEYGNDYIERVDPRDRKYYWTPFERITDTKSCDLTDEFWVKKGYITVTPLLTDLTDFSALQRLNS